MKERGTDAGDWTPYLVKSRCYYLVSPFLCELFNLDFNVQGPLAVLYGNRILHDQLARVPTYVALPPGT